MIDGAKDTARDDDPLRDTLIQMMSIRSGGRFQVITYSGDDGGADEKRDYDSASEAELAARDYVQGKDGLTYDGALVYDKKRRSIARLYGSFPEFVRPVCAQPGQMIQA